MKYGRITGIGKKISRIGQGSMMLKGGKDLDASFTMLDQAWASGITLDTGYVYSGGECDRLSASVNDRAPR